MLTDKPLPLAITMRGMQYLCRSVAAWSAEGFLFVPGLAPLSAEIPMDILAAGSGILQIIPGTFPDLSASD